MRVVKSQDAPKQHSENNCATVVQNGVPSEISVSLINGDANGTLNNIDLSSSPQRENHTKDYQIREDLEIKKDMLPKLYHVLTEDNKLIENVPTKDLM